MKMNTDTPIIIEPSQPAKACVIWLHGLGADGTDFVPIVQQLHLQDKAIRFIFPHAPIRPVTINQHIRMRAWYDIYDLSSLTREDHEGLKQSQRFIETLIDTQLKAGISSQQIALAGFSQGGAVTLYTGLRYSKPLAGLLALSTYLPFADELEQEKNSANQHTPIMQMHGVTDSVISLHTAEKSKDYLIKHNYSVDWRTYPVAHGLHPKMIQDIRDWLKSIFAG